MWALRRLIILWWRSGPASARRKFHRTIQGTLTGCPDHAVDCLQECCSRLTVLCSISCWLAQAEIPVPLARCYGASAIGFERQDGGGDWRDERYWAGAEQ